MTKPQWIVFDLIGVLAEPSWRDLISHDSGIKERWEKLKRGTAEEDAFWDQALQRTYRAVLDFRADRLDLVRDLRKRGVHIAIASNFSREWLKFLMGKIPDPGIFEHTMVSAEVGAAKPEPAFWEQMKQFAPQGSIFVDDQIRNCDAAEQAGYRAVWAHPGAQLEKELERRLAAA